MSALLMFAHAFISYSFLWQEYDCKRTIKLAGFSHDQEPFGIIRYAATKKDLLKVAPGSHDYRAMLDESKWVRTHNLALSPLSPALAQLTANRQFSLRRLMRCLLFFLT